MQNMSQIGLFTPLTSSDENRPCSEWIQLRRIVISCVLMSYTFGLLGMFNDTPKALLPELGMFADVKKEDVKDLQPLFSASFVGNILGSVLGGLAFENFQKPRQIEIMITIMLIILSLSCICMMFVHKVFILGLVMFVNGLCINFIATEIIAFCLKRWGKSCNTCIQLLYCFMAVGAYITFSTLSREEEINEKSREVIYYHRKKEIIVYSVESVLILLSALSWISVFCFDPSALQFGDTEHSSKTTTAKMKAFILITGVPMAFLGTIVDTAYPQLITVYAHGSLDIAKENNTYVNYAFWTSFLVGRIVAIPLAYRFFTVAQLFIFGTTIVFCASIVLLIVPHQSHSVLRITSGFLGLGGATLFPTSLVWINNHMSLDGKLTSIFILLPSISTTWNGVWINDLRYRKSSYSALVILAVPVSYVFLLAFHAVVFKIARIRKEQLHSNTSNRQHKWLAAEEGWQLIQKFLIRKRKKRKPIPEDEHTFGAINRMSGLKSSLQQGNIDNLKLLRDIDQMPINNQSHKSVIEVYAERSTAKEE